MHDYRCTVRGSAAVRQVTRGTYAYICIAWPVYIHTSQCTQKDSIINRSDRSRAIHCTRTVIDCSDRNYLDGSCTHSPLHTVWPLTPSISCSRVVQNVAHVAEVSWCTCVYRRCRYHCAYPPAHRRPLAFGVQSTSPARQ